MLLYHPAFDLNHCNFRLLRLLEALPRDAHELNKLRILDFYLLFPTLLKQVRMPRTAAGDKGMLKKIDVPYERIDDPYRLFLKLEALQRTALKSLASYNIIDAEYLREEKVLRTDKQLPSALVAAITKSNDNKPSVLGLLTGPLFDIEFYGDQGLKARTGLMEHRYDPK